MAGLSCLTVAAAAQTGGAQPAPSGGLNIPQDVSFVGRQVDNNVARATALVNNEIITRTDVDQRVALFLASQRVQLPPEEMERLRAQVLRNLIDEALQIQAAAEAEAKVEQRDVDRYYERFAQEFGHTARSFSDYLRTIGSSDRSVKRQILGELAWQAVQQRKLPRTSPSDVEVQTVLDRLSASRGSTEYRVAEIFLQSTPENAAQIRSNLTQIVEQIRRGASFAAYARQFSQATTAAIGGDLGWVRVEQLPPELAAVVPTMPVQAISDPIQVSGGFSVVAVVDSRQVLMANPRDAVLSLMQMSIDLPTGTTEAAARQRAEQLARATQGMGGCGGAQQAATSLGAELVANDSMKVRDLPPQIQQALLNMSIGQVTPPFGTIERISVLVLCGRDDPEATPTPTFAAIERQLEDARNARQAQRYLRDLRRDAVIEYR